ncbi:MAG: shikimate kinase [Eubacteriales bacterium]|jgi:shikimate kinase
MKDRLDHNIYLIGFMGCGKSSAASYLHRKYGMPVVEMDQQIVDEAGMKISEIFEKKGEESFRAMETDLLRRLSGVKNTVISCGGGAAMRGENVRLMREGGKIVLLTAEPETILERVKNDTGRPLLDGHKNVADIREMMEKRRPAYEAAADVTIATDDRTEAEIAQAILDAVR